MTTVPASGAPDTSQKQDTQRGDITKDCQIVMAPTNKQWVSKLDGVAKLEMVEGEMPVPKDGEVLVKIHAVGINYRDIEG